jgi:hypothetical protein
MCGSHTSNASCVSTGATAPYFVNARGERCHHSYFGHVEERTDAGEQLSGWLSSAIKRSVALDVHWLNVACIGPTTSRRWEPEASKPVADLCPPTHWCWQLTRL